MKNSRYSLVIIIRVILLSLNCFALIWLYTQTNRPATTLFAFILLSFQIGSLIYYHNRINRDLANFLVFLQENDTSLAFSKKRIERSFRGLTYHLDSINQKLQVARIDRERQFHYLQAVVKQVDTGIIAYDGEGKVEIFNHAARELLGIHSQTQIHMLSDLSPELAGLFLAGEKVASSPIKIKTPGGERILAVKSGSLRFDKRVIRLVSLQNIKPELEAGELDAWRKLIRIQRHEIINSITPITTLTTAIKRCFMKDKTRKKLKEITDEHIVDALNSVEVIEDRSRGLIDFVERFRSLTDVPVLRIESMPFEKLTAHLAVLFSKELRARKVRLKVALEPKNLVFSADKKLLEQVLINLVKNSLEAFRQPGGVIVIKAYKDHQQNSIIQVIDNGVGIEEPALESIFVPSYTTKENGSGIGLSISRQIIQMHSGTITVRSEPGVETVVEIVLPER
jgi:two-component system, NtrC family, nitrogen regulation sensor histidine kinase NtrY